MSAPLNVPGGFVSSKAITPEALEILSADAIKAGIEEKLGKPITKFEGISFSTQVVAGLIYMFKVQIDGDEVIHVKVLKPLPHTHQAPFVMDVSTGHTLESSIP